MMILKNAAIGLAALALSILAITVPAIADDATPDSAERPVARCGELVLHQVADQDGLAAAE